MSIVTIIVWAFSLFLINLGRHGFIDSSKDAEVKEIKRPLQVVAILIYFAGLVLNLKMVL